MLTVKFLFKVSPSQMKSSLKADRMNSEESIFQKFNKTNFRAELSFSREPTD